MKRLIEITEEDKGIAFDSGLPIKRVQDELKSLHGFHLLIAK